MQITDCFYLGTITKLHGLNGHVILKLDTDEPEIYYNKESLFIEINGQLIPFFIEEIDPYKSDSIRVLFKDIEAGRLIGNDAYLPLSELPPLEGKKFYFHEVLNFDFKSKEQKVGIISSINDKASQPYFIVITENGSEQLIPIVNDWIIEVNREAKFISMTLPEGLLEL